VVVDVDPIRDERGFFARSWCESEFERAGIHATWVQENVAHNVQKGTLRGLHFQAPPHSEVKFIRCTRGKLWDVALDLRRGSATFRQWFGVELSADNRRGLIVPVGCAHGYVTLTDDVEIRYLTSAPYAPSAAAGVRFDDPWFGVDWPHPATVLSEFDRSWPLVKGERDGRLFDFDSRASK